MADFEVTRSETIAAPPALIHGYIDDFHRWQTWSPWEELDPSMKRDFSGPHAGVGAKYAWEGNRKAGKGNMEIVDSEPDRVEVRLIFEKPFKGDNQVVFELKPTEGDGEGTDVTWTMHGSNKGFAALFTKVLGMDRMVGKDFEKGLAQLKARAESS
jgi:hypothetical protein